MMNHNDLFSIGEVAKAIGITRRMILNYEERGLICPDLKDGTTGNRYYTIDTFTRIRNIRIFQNLGLSLDEIRGYFDDSFELAPLIGRMENLRDELTLHIEKLKERSRTTSGQVRDFYLPRQTVYRCTYSTDSVAEKTVLLRQAAITAMRTYGTDITRRLYFAEYPVGRPSEVSFCVSVPPESCGQHIEVMEETSAIGLYYHGAYERLPIAAEQLLSHARETGRTPRGTLRHIYLEGPPQHKDPAKFITQVVLPVED